MMINRKKLTETKKQFEEDRTEALKQKNNYSVPFFEGAIYIIEEILKGKYDEPNI